MNRTSLLPLSLAGIATFFTLGCVMLAPPPGGATSPGYQPAAEPQAPAGAMGANGGKSASNAVKEAAPPAKMIPTTVEVHSDCGKTQPVFFGDGKPGFSSGRKSSISSNSTSSEGRNHDGTLTIWIIDEHENGLTNVKVTPDTRRVTLNSDCASFKTE